MQGDSDTESEGERVDADGFVQNGSASRSAPHTTVTFDGLEGVLEAIQRIKQCNLDIVQWVSANVCIHVAG